MAHTWTTIWGGPSALRVAWGGSCAIVATLYGSAGRKAEAVLPGSVHRPLDALLRQRRERTVERAADKAPAGQRDDQAVMDGQGEDATSNPQVPDSARQGLRLDRHQPVRQQPLRCV